MSQLLETKSNTLPRNPIAILIVLSLALAGNLNAAWNPLKNKKDKDTGTSVEVENALNRFKELKGLSIFFDKAQGYAVFPSIKKGGIGLGGAFGKGQVFQDNKVIGETSVKQVSIGFQLGGQAFSQIMFFKEKRDLERFTDGNFELGAAASAVLITAGVSADAAYNDGVAIFTVAKGGLMYEASVGGQKFSFKPSDS